MAPSLYNTINAAFKKLYRRFQRLENRIKRTEEHLDIESMSPPLEMLDFSDLLTHVTQDQDDHHDSSSSSSLGDEDVIRPEKSTSQRAPQSETPPSWLQSITIMRSPAEHISPAAPREAYVSTFSPSTWTMATAALLHTARQSAVSAPMRTTVLLQSPLGCLKSVATVDSQNEPRPIGMMSRKDRKATLKWLERPPVKHTRSRHEGTGRTVAASLSRN